MEESMKEETGANRKRQRPEWSMPDEAKYDEQVCLQTPHTLRLLKLIEEGTVSHARMAASHLTSIAASSSPVVLWDLLGRLQTYLLAPEWSCRFNASLAMQGVAQHIPPSDQCEFLQASYAGPLWLTVEELTSGLETILSEGRVLLASSETNSFAAQREEAQLQELDASQEKLQQDFVERRVQLQREILAQRLGLGGLVRAVGGTVLSDVITKEDFLMNDDEDDTKTRQAQHMARIRRQSQEKQNSVSIRALLVLEMQQQHKAERGATSHKNPQTLLATELIYRMFDPSWHVRHGALLGTLALLRAWEGVVEQHRFGVWPHDILARCICVLSLDRFGDYAGTSLGDDGNGGDGVVAPVREMAAQLLSVLWAMAPSSVQDDCLRLLVRMSCRDEWEVRHGALLALKYVVVVVSSNILNQTDCASSEGTIQDISRVALARLSDKMDDVQSVAAQILQSLLKRAENNEPQRTELIEAFCRSLWDALGRVQSISSCAVDFVGLFSSIICADCSLVCKSLTSSEESDLFVLSAVVEKLLNFLEFDSLAVSFSALKAMGSIAQPLATMVAEKNVQNASEMLAQSYCSLLQRVFDTYFCDTYSLISVEGDKENGLQVERLSRVRDDAWVKLVESANPVLTSIPNYRNTLLINLVVRYVGIQQSPATTRNNGVPQKADGLNSLSAHALARLLAKLQFTDDGSFFETTVSLLLYSPWRNHCESGCTLYQSMCSLRSRQGMCPRLLQQLLLGTPPCLAAESAELSSILSTPAVIEACGCEFIAALKGALEGDRPDNFENVWKKLLWDRGVPIPVIDNNPPVAVTTNSMRIHAMIAGTIVAAGKEHLPPKLTPLVRSLMTSLKSERTPERLNLTCDSLALLLNSLTDGEDDESRLRVKTKVMENICTMLYSESLSSEVRHDDSSQAGAARVIALLVSQLPLDQTLENMHPVWSRLQLLVESDPSAMDEESLADSLRLLKIICMSVKRGTAVTRHVIETMMPSMVPTACTCPSSSTRATATYIVVFLCRTEPLLAMDTSLPLILELLGDHENDPRRLGACRLLQSIIEEAGIEICPFVRCLLPITMSLMTDSLEDCAKQAAQSFAALVRVAPLVRQSSRRHWERKAGDDHSDEVIDHLIHGKPLPPCILPAPILEELDLAGVTLRGYQTEGITWLRFLQQVKLNGCLCDEMGLGKSLQGLVAVAISHCDAIRADGSPRPVSLIVCPSTLVGHWLAEIRKFFPGQNVLRGISFVGQSLLLGNNKEYNIVVTSYSILRREIKTLSKKQWHYCILDEGHLLKNPKTATAISARRIRARHKLILTGTPVQNRVHELWAAFDFLMPNFLGSQSWFSTTFARPIGNGQLHGASAESISAGIEKLKLLHQQVLPFILRREKGQVLKELPPKCITDIPCTLSSEQQDLYEQFCTGSEAKKAISALQNVVAQPRNGDKGEGASVETRPTNLGGDALRSLLYLRLLCTHPSLVNRSRKKTFTSANEAANSRGMDDDEVYAHLDSSGKLKVLNELLRSAHICGDELMAADNDASVLYSEFDDKNEGDDLAAVLGSDENMGSGISGLATGRQANESQGSKCLIFAQFKQSLDVVEEFLFRPHMPSLRYLRLDGTVPPEKRSDIAEAFNRDDSIKVMLLTTRVGGLGLNLTGASTVIFLEHDYNPHADLQAMDRVHRIGQNKAVNVYRLVTQNTIEEKIMKLQESKLALSNAIVNSDNSTMYSMGTDRLLDIFTFRSDDKNQNGRSGGAGNENDLDALNEMFSADDYATLSVQEFISGFESIQSDTSAT